MRARYFLLGVLVGLLLAPVSGSEMWRRLRDQLAAAIDALLRLSPHGVNRLRDAL